jgi:hypothetical protein
MQTPQNDRVTLMLSIQRALLGEVSSRLAAVITRLMGPTIVIRAYFFGSVLPEDSDTIEEVASEVIADFSAPYTVHVTCLPIAEFGPLEKDDLWVFLHSDAVKLVR